MAIFSVKTKGQPPVNLGKVFVSHADVASLLEKYLNSPEDLHDSKKITDVNLSIRELYATYVLFQFREVRRKRAQLLSLNFVMRI